MTWLLLCCLLGGRAAYGQGETGGLPTRTYLPSQYNAHSQNFAVTQDRRGVLYVGNFAGVLEYDGLTWRTIPTANITKVSALLTAANGMVYVGANGEFGYLAPDSVGALRFRSLSQRTKTRFNEVLAVVEAKDGIYFVARNVLFQWNGKALREWASPVPIQSGYQLGQSLYVFQPQRGLSTFAQGKWRAVALQADFSTLYGLVGMLPTGGGKALLVTTNHGLLQLANNVIRPYPSAANDLLLSDQPSGAAVLPDHSLAVSTQSGVLLLDAAGQFKQKFRYSVNLSGQLINAIYADRESNLWLALDNGLAQVEVPSPLTLFTESAQQTGEITDIRRVGGVLYLAAANGLFRLQNGQPRPVGGLNIGSFKLAEAGGTLFVATSRGLFQLTANGPRELTQEYTICVLASKANPSLLYVGTQNGLGEVTLKPGQAPSYRALPGLSERVFGIEEAGDGSVWLETLTAGLYRLLPATGELRHYAAAQGLPTQLYNHLATVEGRLLAYNDKGIFRFDDARNRFVVFNPFGKHSVAENWKNSLLEDDAGNVWTVEGDKKTITLHQKTKSGFTSVTAPFLPLSTSPINLIYPDQQGVVWFGGRDGLVRYDPTVRKAYAQPYDALIRQVQTVGEKTLFDGARAASTASADTLNYGAVKLDPNGNDINFEFAAATFPVGQALTFQYMLENYDRIWSDWTATNTKEYTNLPPGQYRFRVQARNIYGTTSREATYAFTVLAPWYARWWAIALFVAAGGLLLSWVVRWRLAAVVREKQALETLIQERTEEVVSQKAELEKQSDELAVKNDQLEKIDLIVQSINAEIDFANLFQMILAKFSVIRNMNSASFLIYDKPTESFRFKALRGNRDLSYVQSVQLTLEQAENRYLTNAVEVYEDIYLKNQVDFAALGSPIDDLTTPKSLITIVIESEGHIEGFITLENTTRTDAFDERDISMICNLKEHLIAAFIKTRLLESLENTLNDLENTQGELIRQEKLASVGQLTKGIVDRILNPLNYVTNFSQSSDEVISEVVEILEKQQELLPAATLDDLLDELNVLKTNSVKIQEHSASTTRILKDMQKLLKEKSRDLIETDLNAFIENKARAAIQELSPEYKTFAINLEFDLEPLPVRISLLPYEFGQVVQSIVSNAYYTLFEKSKTAKDFAPALRISTRLADGQVVVRLRDNGKGIAAREVPKLFSPFFTTKPTSKGTGLGLFMAKDIVETHKGKIEIDTLEGEFTQITMTLPTLNG
ncbi:sensor histidine kinase [Hymenobacter rubidus]|uniref:sensor histidine kinase n=1 Tax=Hymenobacter rubidus TaxID=1441626 RepID=UPI00191EB0E9|nr:ATP-binding protein [Hymenobacter rubidus]